MNKIWHKPLHKRKVWKNMSLSSKIIYYIQPFGANLIDTWLQPLPFPTMFKFLYSGLILTIMFLPIIFPVIICISYYFIIQYLVESSLNIVYPRNVDIIHNLVDLFNFEIKNERHIEFINLYMERWRYIASAFASCVDYIRLGLSLVLGSE